MFLKLAGWHMSSILFKFQTQPDLLVKFQTRQGYTVQHLQIQHLGVRGRKMRSLSLRLCLKTSWVNLEHVSAHEVVEVQCHCWPAGVSSVLRKMWQRVQDSVKDVNLLPRVVLPRDFLLLQSNPASVLRHTSAALCKCPDSPISESMLEELHRQCRPGPMF